MRLWVREGPSAISKFFQGVWLKRCLIQELSYLAKRISIAIQRVNVIAWWQRQDSSTVYEDALLLQFRNGLVRPSKIITVPTQTTIFRQLTFDNLPKDSYPARKTNFYWHVCHLLVLQESKHLKQQFTLHHHQLDLQIDSQNIKHVDLAKLSKASNPSSNKFQRQISDAFEQKCAFLLLLSPLILYAFWDVDKGKFSAAGFWTQKGPVVTHKFMSRRIPKSSSIQNYIYKGCSQKA